MGYPGLRIGAVVGGLMIGWLIASTVSAAVDSTYEIWTERGRDYLVGRNGNLIVRFFPVKGSKEIGAWISIINNGNEAVEISPERVKVVAITKSGKHENRKRLMTYHPIQYESMLRRRNHEVGSLGPNTASAGSPSGRSTQSSSGSYSSGRCGPGGLWKCVDDGPRTSPNQNSPTENPMPQVWQPASFSDSGSQRLLRPSKIPSKEALEGVVYIKYKLADSYQISILIGDASFEFHFRLP